MTDPTPDALLIKLLDIRAKIAERRRQERSVPWLITDTLRHAAMDATAAFVDPTWWAEQVEKEHSCV